MGLTLVEWTRVVATSLPTKRHHHLIWKKQRVRVTKPARSDVFTYDRLLPCPDDQLPARIEHLLVEKGGNVVDVVCEALSLPSPYVNDLIEFGAVYRALRFSQPPETAPLEHLEFYKRACAMNLPRIKGMSVQESGKARRIVGKHDEVEAGSYMRVHVHPRRFPRCYEVDWKSRILAHEKSFVVLDKPAGVSVGGSVDNLEECCVTFAARALNLPFPFYVTHQIDNCTEGCVVLAKDKEFVSRFNTLLQKRKVDKTYRVLAASSVPLGIITHYMRPDHYAPHLVSEDEREGWHVCKLEVTECIQAPWPSDILLRKHSIDNCGWEPAPCAYECQLKLLTGRTHQVRAQFAALGAPILGDTIYMPAAMARLKDPNVDSVLTMHNEWSEAREEKWILYHGCTAPKVAICLQASSISWKEEEEDGYNFTADKPWWRE